MALSSAFITHEALVEFNRLTDAALAIVVNFGPKRICEEGLDALIEEITPWVEGLRE